ncbi:MAG: divergent PAP2 family protein [Oscillospiraceae bacterium]|nr:divergent PAP2 family protein [Oscillospiraceae bacterium]
MSILIIAVLSWCLSQFIKTMINLFKNGKFDFERLFGAGGWPSAHSSMVCSASIAVGRTEGFNTTIFAVVAIFSLITMYDAMGVRREAGQHARAINKINKYLTEMKNPATFEDIASAANKSIKALKEYVGHTPFEVVSGALIGIAFGFVMPLNIVP